MNAELGKRIRLGRILNRQSGRAIIVAYAHGVLIGPQPGMMSAAEIDAVSQKLAGADAVMVTPGMLRYCADLFAQNGAPALMMLLDWQSVSRDRETQLGYEEGASTLMGSVERAVASGVDGVMTYLYLGYRDPEQEAREIAKNVAVKEACERFGLIHMIESRAVRNELLPDGRYNPDMIKLHTRIACELGADLVKTKYTGSVESFREVTATCLCPVLIAGGKMSEDPREALQMAEDAIAAGAAGIVFGRNIYQRENPAEMLRSFAEVVHRGRPARDVVKSSPGEGAAER